MSDVPSTCSGHNRKGEPCGRRVSRGRRYCIFHKPGGIRIEIIAAIIGFTGVILAPYTPHFFGLWSSPGHLEVADSALLYRHYGLSTIPLLDVKVRNDSGSPVRLVRLNVSLLELFTFECETDSRHYRVRSEGFYNVSLSDLVKGEESSFSIYHEVPSGGSDRLLIAFGGRHTNASPPGSAASLARIGVTLWTDREQPHDIEPVNILILDYDRAQQVQLGDEQLEAFGERTRLHVVNGDDVRDHLQDCNIQPPSWFTG